MYGRNKKRVESVLFTKSSRKSTRRPEPVEELSSSASLRNIDDEDSVVRRPVRHLNNVCLCYDNPEDCTTCTEENSVRSDQMFMLDDAEPEFRFRGGSSPASSSFSSSDGSSLFEEDFARKLEENLEFNESVASSFLVSSRSLRSILEESVIPSIASSESAANSSVAETSATIETRNEMLHRKIGTVCRRFPKIRNGLAREIAKFGEFLKNDSQTFGKLIAMHGYQKALLCDALELLEEKLEEKNAQFERKMDEIDEETVQLFLAESWLAKCKEEHAIIRKEYLERLIDEDLIKSNMLRIGELRRQMDECRKADRGPDVDTQMELQAILDDVSTCESFSGYNCW